MARGADPCDGVSFARDERTEMGKHNEPASDVAGSLKSPGNDLLSRGKHYHRPRMLNGRVRNGNGCGHPGLVTGKSHRNAQGWPSLGFRYAIRQQ